MDVKYRRKVITQENKIKIVNDFNSGMKIADVLSNNNISRGSLYKVLKEAKEIKEMEGSTAPATETPQNES